MTKKKTSAITTVIIAVAVILFQYIGNNSDTKATLSTVASNTQVETLYANRQSNTVIETSGNVIKLLADDLEGSKHQKFILKLASGHTVLISHNIDLAPRIKTLREKDNVRIKGEYEWSDKGGVIHWTHHDPAGNHEGGWIEHNNKRYE